MAPRYTEWQIAFFHIARSGKSVVAVIRKTKAGEVTYFSLDKSRGVYFHDSAEQVCTQGSPPCSQRGFKIFLYSLRERCFGHSSCLVVFEREFSRVLLVVPKVSAAGLIAPTHSL